MLVFYQECVADRHHRFGMNETEFKIEILLVDDDARILRFLRISLVGHGYEVLTAGDGEEALATTPNPHRNTTI